MAATEWQSIGGEPTPRKQRTRQHVIADQSANHVERFIIDEGHTAQHWAHDYGCDLTLITYDERGYVEPGSISIQLKATETLEETGDDYVFDIDVRDYRLWMLELMPVYLILFGAARRRAYWLDVQSYFRGEATQKTKQVGNTIRVRVPKRQVIGRRAVERMRQRKQMVLDRLKKVIPP
jgi:hypothetical protein